ncbi:hypothetical protein ACQKGO_10760 [Corallococcus interemptor]|uniref:hypothetical protein n=1 Tax=Corallococcus interemptor TaxID=2316720 RepID=UPI003CFEC9DC
MNRLLLVMLLALLGCGGSGQPAPPPGAVSRVTVKGETRVPSEGSTVLTADVEGTGTYVSDVDWYLLSGEGFLSNAVGASVTYTAPLAPEELTVTLQAVSLMDPSKTATFTLTVSQAPAASLLVGTYAGTLSTHDQVTAASGPVTTEDKLEDISFTLTRVSDTRVQLSGIGHLGLGFPSGIPLEVREDGTLGFPSQAGERRRHDKYCWKQYFINEPDAAPGIGSWDRRGHLSLNWVSILEQECTHPVTGATSETTHRLEQAFLGTRG